MKKAYLGEKKIVLYLSHFKQKPQTIVINTRGLLTWGILTIQKKKQKKQKKTALYTVAFLLLTQLLTL